MTLGKEMRFKSRLQQPTRFNGSDRSNSRGLFFDLASHGAESSPDRSKLPRLVSSPNTPNFKLQLSQKQTEVMISGSDQKPKTVSMLSSSIKGSSRQNSSRKSSVCMTPSKFFNLSVPIKFDRESGRVEST